MHNKGNCNCSVCQELRKKAKHESQILKELDHKSKEFLVKYGYYVHYVPATDEIDFCNCHTHGLPLMKRHLDFQIVLPIHQNIAGHIIKNFVDRIDQGEQFEDGMEVNEIISNFPVRLIKAKEGNRDVLRIILPDPKGRFPGDTDCDPFYDFQDKVFI